MLTQIEDLLDREVRPALRAHGGAVEVLDYAPAEGALSLRLLGSCSGCPAAELGTRDMIEEVFRTGLPQVQSISLVHSVSDDLLDQARTILRGGAL